MKAGNWPRNSQCCQSDANKEFWPSSVIGLGGGGGGGVTHQMTWCEWANEMMKSSSKNIVVNIKKYARIIFPILKYTILNRGYALDRKFMPSHQIWPKDLQ